MNSLTTVGYGKSWFCISKSVEKSFKSYLKRTNMTFHPYQLEGVKWCVFGKQMFHLYMVLKVDF